MNESGPDLYIRIKILEKAQKRGRAEGGHRNGRTRKATDKTAEHTQTL